MRDPHFTPHPELDDDGDFPVLTDVVREGDVELIEAAREAFDDARRIAEPDINEEISPPPSGPVPAPLTPAAISRSITSPTTGLPDSGPFATRGGTQIPLTEAQLEQLIDEIIERHAEQMRNELHTILKHR